MPSIEGKSYGVGCSITTARVAVSPNECSQHGAARLAHGIDAMISRTSGVAGRVRYTW